MTYRRMASAALIILLASSFASAEEADVPRFNISRITLEGNSILPQSAIDTILTKYTGPQKDFGDLQEATEELEAAYRSRGYTMVTVVLPEQQLQRGTITLRAIESRVRQVVIEGQQHHSRDNILAALPTLRLGEPPRVNAISENLRAANENPSKKITLQFKTPDKPEDLTAYLQVNDQKPWKIALSGDNTGSDKRTGYYRTGITLQHANLWNRDHVASLSYSTSPEQPDKVLTLSGSYRMPIYSLGDTIDLFGAYSDSDIMQNTSAFNLSGSGKGIVSGLRYNITLPRFNAYEQKLQIGMDYRIYDTTAILQTGDANYGDIVPDVVAHPVSLTYGGTWNDEMVTVDASIGLLHNQPWGGQGMQRHFSATRNGAVADYTILRYTINKMVRLPHDIMIRTYGTGQYTPDRLISGEQYGIGGSTSVRGYREREESYDGGFNGGIELFTPDLGKLLDLPKTQLRIAGFFDGGTGYTLRPQGGEKTDGALTSTGIGFRLGISDFFSFSLDWGHALRHAATTRRGDSAIHFKGAISY